MRKKLVACILIILILINTAIPNFIYAAEPEKKVTDTGSYQDVQEHQAETGKDTVDQVFEEEKATVSPSNGSSRNEDLGEGATSSNLVASALGSLLSLFPQAINGILTLVINSTQKASSEKLSATNRFTIEDLVLGKYDLFDINFLDFNATSTNINDEVKQNVAIWYFSLRNIAIVGNLLVLVYVGIRIAISSAATEQAKYKKMLYNWVLSFILIFVMHYIISFLFGIQSLLISFVSELTLGEGFEEDVINNTWNTLGESKGWNCVVYVIEIYILVYYQLKFFLVYFKRFLEVGFLFTIAPLITVFDAINSPKSGIPIFKKWCKQITYSIFLQVIHAAVYAIFILSAASIAKKMPIIGMLLLMTLSRTEKIIKSTFSMKGKGLADEKLLDRIKQKGK